MKLESRSLSVGVQGPAIRDLHHALAWLGIELASDELRDSLFGPSTRAAIQLVQKKGRLPASGVVDANTVALIEKQLSAFKRVVRGQVLQANGKPIQKAKVRAFDKAVRADTLLGEATTDASGFFEIDYTFGLKDRSSPNLLLKAFSRARSSDAIATSTTIFNADPELLVTLTADDAQYRGPSEFEQLIQDLSLAGEGVELADLTEDDKTQDVTFLSNQSGHPVDQVTYAVLAHRYAKVSGLDPEGLYAWMRKGLPTEASRLLAQDAGTLRRTLVDAVNGNLIPQGFETDVSWEAIAKRLVAWRATVALEDPADEKHLTLGRLLKGILSTDAQSQRFLRAYDKHTGPIEGFWKGLEQDAQLAPHAASLEFSVLLASLGGNHLPLIDAVNRRRSLKSLTDLASLDEAAWYTLITDANVSPPDDIEGADDVDRLRQYARTLANSVESAIPTQFFAARLAETELDGKADLQRFFKSQSRFDIHDTPVSVYLKAHPTALDGLQDKTRAEKQLKGLQRAFRISSSAKAAMALHRQGDDSAQRISRMGQNTFVTRYAKHFDNAEKAKKAYARARQVNASAIALFADVNPAANGVPTYVVPDVAARQIPDWSDLLGSLSSCACESCQSVYSPAAYLVDVLNFLDDRKEAPADPSAKDVLFAAGRRPDLGEIELTCDNTNIVLPYVDLVLEILEDAVAPPPAFSAFDLDASNAAGLDASGIPDAVRSAFGVDVLRDATVRVRKSGEQWIIDARAFSYEIRKQGGGALRVTKRSRQTCGTPQERAATPQYVNLDAYVKLESARFPWTLPLDRSLEEARTYLNHLETPRREILERFLPGDRRTVLSNFVLATETLGLSFDVANLVSGLDLTPRWQHWGFPASPPIDDAAGIATIQEVGTFLQRSGMAFAELPQLLICEFLNPDQAMTLVSTDGQNPNTCDLAQLQIRGLTPERADLIVRFVRLWRALGWRLTEIDQALLAVTDETTRKLDATALTRLSHLARLQAQFSLPVGRLAVFWRSLDPTLYPGGPDALTGSLDGALQALSATLEISGTDLRLLVDDPLVNPDGPTAQVTLNRVSLIHRHATLAKALKLSATDYLLAIVLLGPDPFADTINTVLFVETLTQVRASGFTLIELDYLLRHASETSSGIGFTERDITDRLRDVGQEVFKGAAEEVIARKLAEAFKLEMSTVKLLRPQWSSLMDPQLGASSDYLTRRLRDPTILAEPANPELDRNNFAAQFQALVRLQKISIFSARLHVSVDVFEWLLTQTVVPNLLDLKALPVTSNATAEFEHWLNLIQLLDTRYACPQGDGSWLQLLKEAVSGSLNGFLDTAVIATTWRRSDLEYLTGTTGLGLVYPADYTSACALSRLRSANALIARLGMSAEQITKLAYEKVTSSAALGVRQAARAKYDEPKWQTLAKPLCDVLRDRQRSALVSYLTSGIAGSAWPNASALYGHLMVDVEMSPCMVTSRLRLAITSVQLFVQRCLMNLEDEVQADQDNAWNWWHWMKSYALWVVQRKLFLTPENWLRPDQRDDKSPFFRELESELMESDLTLETAASAFKTYLEKLDRVARPQIMGLCQQDEHSGKLVHVFARTSSLPRTHYYRQRVNDAYWTPWEKMDVDIDGDHLIPVIWHNRPYLFWPVFTEKSDPAGNLTLPPLNAGGPVGNTQTRKYWEIKIAWSERRQDRWLDKQLSADAGVIKITGRKLPDLAKVFFTVNVGKDLLIDQTYVTETKPRIPSFWDSILHPRHFVNVGMGNMQIDPDDIADAADPAISGLEGSYISGLQNAFHFGGCSAGPAVIPHGASAIGSGKQVLPGTVRAYMVFREVPDAALSLPIRRDVDHCRPALARTPGSYSYTVVTPAGIPHVTRGHFVFQDFARSYFVTPILTSQDQITVDPGELGGRLAIGRRSASSSDQPDASGGFRSSGATGRIAGPAAAGVAFGGNVAPPAVALRPDTHTIMPFAPRATTKYGFAPLYHPHVCALISILNRDGVDQMLRRDVQRNPQAFGPGSPPAEPFDFEASYAPTDMVVQPYPIEDLDFSFSGANSVYNWELFFHAPLLIADRLSQNQRFEDATKWFHYIFNPSDNSSADFPSKFWQTKPFFETTNEDYQRDRLENLFTLLARGNELRSVASPTPEQARDLERLKDLEASVRAWRDNPFKPHLIARMRTTAYQKAVVMRYIDNLIAWGDQCFRRDTMESVDEATQLYVLAANILGPRPVKNPSWNVPRTQTYNSLDGELDVFSNALVELEALIPVDPSPTAPVGDTPPLRMLHFCLPRNDKLLGYWDTVADRLFKIRHCQNIEGVIRKLPLFESPIDPAILLSGAAAGLDLSSLLNETAISLPSHRFTVLSQKAMELCGDLRALGATMLSALEKRDAEALMLLRSQHESQLLEKIGHVREQQLAEAEEQLQVLSASRDVVVGRLGHFQRLLGEESTVPVIGERIQEKAAPRFSEVLNLAGVKMFPHEFIENALLTEAEVLEIVAAGAKTLSAVMYIVPEMNAMFMGVGVSKGQYGDIPSAVADAASRTSSAFQLGASMTGRVAGYVARELDWVLQHNQAAREIAQVDRQIAAARVRREIANLELRNHLRQRDDAQEVESYMRDKFTNPELYGWMVGQMSGVYFQAYQLAYDTARRAEACYHHEIGVERDALRYITFGYWDSLKKGLLAGEKLHHDLKRMEVAFLDNNKRELEITKHLSLAQLDPQALLQLKNKGKCTFHVPEAVFDLDHPGHYRRRHKSVALTIPCVAGPYTSVSCKLILGANRYRKNDTWSAAGSAIEEYRESSTSTVRDERFSADIVGAQMTIATSSGQSDSGLFDLNFRDERYLPFEGTGTIADWTLELPTAFRQFDYNTISDVVLHLRYTALDGKPEFRDRVEVAQRELMNIMTLVASRAGLYQAYSLRQDFPNEWARLKQTGTTALVLSPEHLPFLTRSHAPAVDQASWFARFKTDPASYEIGVNASPVPLAKNESMGLWAGTGQVFTLGTPLTISAAIPSELEDLTILLRYTLSS